MTLLDLRPGAVQDGGEDPNLPARGFPRPVSSVFADLLPDEVRTKRRLAYLKRRLAFGLIALALLIGLGYALARQQTDAASDDLATAHLRIGALNQQATRYGPVVGVQSETQQIMSLLTQAMSGDVPWARLTSTLQKVAPRGLALTGVDGAIGAGDGNAAPAAPAATGARGATGPVVIGSLTLTGTAPGYRDVADYVSALATVPGIVAVTPQTTATNGAAGGSVTFTVTASLTTAATGGQYAPTSTVAPSAGAASTAPGAGATSATPPAAAPVAGPSSAVTPVGN